MFYEVNDIEFDWKRIRRGLPRANYVAHDRNPTIEEIRKLMAYPDRRVKVIVLILISSGIRVGAFDYLKWKHVIPIIENKNNNKEIIAAKLIVYAGEPKEHFTFMMPEAYEAIKEYMDFRKLHEENVTGESWLIRDKFPTTSEKHAANKSMRTNPKKCNSEAIKEAFAACLGCTVTNSH